MRHFLLVTTALLISSPALAQHEGHGAVWQAEQRLKVSPLNVQRAPAELTP